MNTTRTTVVAGGTAGLGLGVAHARLAAGDRVTVIGRNPQRGHAFLDAAAALGAGNRAAYIPGDLATAAGAREVIRQVQLMNDRVDALVMTAYAPQFRRRITADGVETSLALYYLARRILGEGLDPQLDAAPRPVIVSFNGVGAVRGHIHWDDLMLEHRYRMVEATKQAGRAAELLAVDHADGNTPRRARYVLFHPGFTRTAATGLPFAARLASKAAAVVAQPVEKAIRPVLSVFESPPNEPLTAIDRGRRLDAATITDRDDAARLATLMAPYVGLDRPTTPPPPRA